MCKGGNSVKKNDLIFQQWSTLKFTPQKQDVDPFYVN